MDALVEQIRAAQQAGVRLSIAGHGSKAAWLPESDGQLLSLQDHTGIDSYTPDELVVTARAGTPIKTLRQALAQHQQRLAFEPPEYRAAGTVGGMVASGLSGPGRPWGGSLRDAVLGVDMINGRAERLRFGGQVVKNVAGYDVSRLQAGAWGSLGVLLSVSLRVMPAPQAERTVRLELDQTQALQTVRELARSSLPLTASCWNDGILMLRIAGMESAVLQALPAIGGEVSEDQTDWALLRDHRWPFFNVASPEALSRQRTHLWRLIVPPASSPIAAADEDVLIEWAGGLRWWWCHDTALVRTYVTEQGGWAWRLGEPCPIDGLQGQHMAALKQAFDPDHVFSSPLVFE